MTVVCAAGLLQTFLQRRQLLLLPVLGAHGLGTLDKSRGLAATDARTPSGKYARTAATTKNPFGKETAGTDIFLAPAAQLMGALGHYQCKPAIDPVHA